MPVFWTYLSLLLLPLGTLLPWQACLRRRAEARASHMAQELAARSRQFDLVAQELRGIGLTLMGQSSAHPDPRLEDQARALLGLAADVHDVAAGSAGPRVLTEERTPLAPLLQEVIELVSLALVPGRRQWRLSEELQQASLLADPRALRGALTQVLTRAVRHTRDGDPIALKLVRSAETVAIVVEDEGAGLSAEDLDMASPVLAQRPGAGESAPGRGGTRGLGLGLVVARQLLQAHDGELTIEAVQGIGARTWLTLPRYRLLEALPAPA